MKKFVLKGLKEFTGTENYYKIPFSKVVYTDGINKLINSCGCWWLISDLGIEISDNSKFQKPFLIVGLKVNEDGTAELTIKEDSDLKPIYFKKYTFTDFPLKEFEFYLVNNVFLLKSEY